MHTNAVIISYLPCDYLIDIITIIHDNVEIKCRQRTVHTPTDANTDKLQSLLAKADVHKYPISQTRTHTHTHTTRSHI